MPVVMLGVKQRDAGRVNGNNLSVRIKDFLRRKRTDCCHIIDEARRFLAAASDLQGPVPKVPVCRGEAEKLALACVLYAEMFRCLLDDVRNSPPSACASLDETTTGGAVCAAIGVATAVSVSIIENTREKRVVTMFVLRHVAVIRSRVIEHLGRPRGLRTRARSPPMPSPLRAGIAPRGDR
jgi:hypothetical protein